MTVSFFQARDEMDRVFLAGSDMPGITRAVFRHLLEHMMYSGESYGWVVRSASGVSTIAVITGFSERAVKSHLRMLEANGLITRHRHRTGTGTGPGGRSADRIRVEWDYLHNEGASGARASGAPSGGDEGASGAPSTIYKEELLQEPGAEVIDLASRRKHV